MITKLCTMIIGRLIKIIYNKKPNTKTALMFIPHSGMCIDDKYDLFNYKSESAYTFARYIIDNKLEPQKKIYLSVTLIFF